MPAWALRSCDTRDANGRAGTCACSITVAVPVISVDVEEADEKHGDVFMFKAKQENETPNHMPITSATLGNEPATGPGQEAGTTPGQEARTEPSGYVSSFEEKQKNEKTKNKKKC